MAQLLIRNLEDDLKVLLQCRAKRHNQSMEEEVRDILRNALRNEETAIGMGTQIAALFQQNGLKEEISELSGHPVAPVLFKP